MTLDHEARKTLLRTVGSRTRCELFHRVREYLLSRSYSLRAHRYF